MKSLDILLIVSLNTQRLYNVYGKLFGWIEGHCFYNDTGFVIGQLNGEKLNNGLGKLITRMNDLKIITADWLLVWKNKWRKIIK